METIDSWKTQGATRRIELQKNDSGLYDIVFFEHGRADCRWPNKTEETARKRILDHIQTIAISDNIHYHPNPGRMLINATKKLTLMQRVELLESVLSELGEVFPLTSGVARMVRNRLVSRGYEPMMFQQASRIVIQRQQKFQGSV